MVLDRPHFLCIGAQKSATTWLAHTLRQHPGLWLPPVKELHYFDTDLRSRREGRDHRLGSAPPLVRSLRQDTHDGARARLALRLLRQGKASPRWVARYLLRRRTDRWYRSLFADAPGVAGEVTPAYAVLDEPTVASVAARLPEVRVLYLMRDPVERAWSAARMLASTREGAALDAWPAADQVAYLRRFAPRLLPHSDYAAVLSRWERHVAPERVFTGFFEDVAQAPAALLASAARFLGVDPAWVPADAHQPRNARGRGQDVPPEAGRWLSERLSGVAEWAHVRFGNGHTAGWVETAAHHLDVPA